MTTGLFSFTPGARAPLVNFVYNVVHFLNKLITLRDFTTTRRLLFLYYLLSPGLLYNYGLDLPYIDHWHTLLDLDTEHLRT